MILLSRPLLVLCCTVFCVISTVAQLSPGKVVRVSVIFHVLYSDTEPDNGINATSRDDGNSTTNITSDKLRAELQDLHDDFLALNQDTAQVLPLYKLLIASPNIEFVLADSVFTSGGEKGIIRIQTNNNNDEEMWEASPVIDPQKYLNVYIGRINGSEGITNLPLNADFHYNDGCRLNYKWVGLHYRLLTHEAGHWLGLLHIYGGNGGSKGNRQSCTFGDGIDDTPPQDHSTDVLCVTCPPPYGTARDRSCKSGTPSNYNNFMDYSGCRFMFTRGQVEKMRTTLANFRPLIVSNSP